MILKAFAIYDTKGERYHQPFFKNAYGEAERDFQSLARDEKTQIGQFPEDFDLFHVGDYDDQKGIFIALDTPRHIVKATALVRI